MRINELLRSIRVGIKRQHAKKNVNRVIFCNMCLGGVLSHDFKLRFCSPTVNLMITGHEFVEMMKNPRQIEGCITEVTDSGKNYPVGLLNNQYHLHFIHYKNFDEAAAVWKRRTKRVDYSQIYVILVETASCSYSDLEAFDKLPYQHKIALVHEEYPEIRCSKVIPGYDGRNLHGEILGYIGKSGRRLYDHVNRLDFLELKKE